MKNVKIIILLLLCVNFAAIQAEDPNFQFWNKTDSNLTLQVFIGRKIGGSVEEWTSPGTIVKSGEKLQFGENIPLPAELLIFINSRRYVITRCPGQNCYKTIYLSYDNNGLRPQKGPLDGLFGITDSGYNNSENIKQQFIQTPRQ